MKITSLNLQGFENWGERSVSIENFLNSVNPDVIFFQEVVYLPDISPISQVGHLASRLNYGHRQESITRLQQSVKYGDYREGLAVLSRYPIVSSESIALKKAEGDEHNRIIQLIDIDVDGRLVKLANVHFSITDITDFATAHLEETLSILEARGEVRIIAGDMNLSNINESESLWGDKYFVHTDGNYITYPGKNKSTDYFLVPKTCTLNELSISEDGLSDHRAITASINLND